jgi:hypothetical protein
MINQSSSWFLFKQIISNISTVLLCTASISNKDQVHIGLRKAYSRLSDAHLYVNEDIVIIEKRLHRLSHSLRSLL